MRVFIVALFLFIAGCGAGQFQVSQVDTSFSEDKRPVITSENNRISSKSIAGGVHIDASGVFLNPFVIKSEAGQPETVGFNIINKTEYSTAYGGVNQLGIIQKVTFKLSDGDLIAVDVVNRSNQSADTIGYNSLTRVASYDKQETGVAVLSMDDFERVAMASGLSCKIEGTRQSVVYEEKDIAAGFVANVGQFYGQYVK